MKKLAMVLCLLALAAFGVAACGDDDEESGDETAATTTTEETTAGGGGGGAGGTVSFEADPDGALAYTTDSASVAAGEVTIEFDNPSGTGHDVVVEDADGNELARTDVITDSSTSTTAELESGEYTFFCSVAGHRDAGMEGTLTVE
jgi:plastocyanin